MGRTGLHNLCDTVRDRIKEYGFEELNNYTDFEEGVAHRVVINKSLALKADVWNNLNELRTIGISFGIDMSNPGIFAQRRPEVRAYILSVVGTYMKSVTSSVEAYRIDRNLIVGFQLPSIKWDETFKTVGFYRDYLRLNSRFRPFETPPLFEVISEEIYKEIAETAMKS